MQRIIFKNPKIGRKQRDIWRIHTVLRGTVVIGQWSGVSGQGVSGQGSVVRGGSGLGGEGAFPSLPRTEGFFRRKRLRMGCTNGETVQAGPGAASGKTGSEALPAWVKAHRL